MVGGAVVALVSVAGLVLGLGESTTTNASTADAGGSTASPIPETPTEFLAALQRAERNGDAEFRLARLHPAVIERYGEDACRSFVIEPPDATSTFDVVRVDHTGPWDYTSDGETTTVDDTAFVVVDRVARGDQNQVEVHVAAVGNEYRWFADCTPT